MQVYTLSNSRDQLFSKNTSSLLYQLNLLKQRNKLLNLQNQNLVLKVEQLQKQITNSKGKYKQYMKEKNQFINTLQKSKLQIDSIIKALSQKFEINKQKKVFQQLKRNQCSLHSLLQILRQTIQHKLQSGQKKIKSQQNLNRLNKLVQRRRQKILQRQKQKKQIIHVIKQPVFKQTYLTEADLEYVMRSSEKLIRRVKKSEIRNQQISKIIDQISNYIRLRQVIRKQQRKLQELEREAQLGVGSRLTVEVMGNQLMALQVDELNLKKAIQAMIFNL